MDLITRIHAYKPAASARIRAFLAACMWTAVGSVLAIVGVRWVVNSDLAYAWLFILLAIAAGALKSRFVLERSAIRSVERIRLRGDGYCVGGFFSWRAWIFVVAMACLGKFLRGGLFPLHIVGLLYVAVGSALLLASRRLWQGWRRLGPDRENP